MPELTELLQPARERIDEIGVADLVVGILSPSPSHDVEAMIAGIRGSVDRLYMPVRTVVVHAGDPIAGAKGDLHTLALPPLMRDAAHDPAYAISDGFQSLFAVSESLHARATVAIVSGLDSVTPEWIYRLMRPVLELDFDLVAPRYAHTRFEGLLNSGVVAPFTRALYGRQVRHPLGPDFAFSQKLVTHLRSKSVGNRTVRERSLASILLDAICDGFEICQASVGDRHYPPTDWQNQSSVLTQVLGPLFSEAEKHASFWQRIRGSQPIPEFGESAIIRQEHDPLDVRRMVESFHIGHNNLREVWGTVMPPGTLLELGKLARLPLEQFQMPDRLWARILYDFALGHRLRIINQEHLLRAMTPLYLAWVASFALEAGETDAAGTERRLEQLELAFETAKPYVLSRWRWPDRFNP